MKRNQSGFTLIEIAIVLVIIGLLLGGVLKGQELINSAKVKNLANDFKNVPVFIYGYQDKFKALPGDQTQGSLDSQFPPNSTGTVCTPTAAGKCATNNGVVDGGWDATAVTDESFVFWQHVRLAGFGPGATATGSADYRPKNAVNGFIGVTNAAQSPVTGIKGTYIVCSDAIPGKFAKQLDTTLDDSNTATGSVMVVAAGTPTTTPVAPLATTAIVDDTTYLVCMGY
ncbi:MAG TPA: prepilin-type N-terminal cleavage/methylation domain-containing protein [Gallionella sp.]